ncbi:MAG: TldD/PmbA family protein [Burkholderiales bacterium]
MIDTIARSFKALNSSAPFFSLRYVDEISETLSLRQGVQEPPRILTDRGVMLTAIVAGGCGYAATSDLSQSGLQQALDRATQWAETTRHASVIAYDPARVTSAAGRWNSPPSPIPLPTRSERYDILAAECNAAQIDDRIVDRYASIDHIHTEQLYLSNQDAEIHQQFRYVISHAYVSANRNAETQTRSFQLAQQGGADILQRSGFFGSGKRLAEEALQLLLTANCPSGKMDLLLMPDQMMLQIHESIGHPLELDRILGDERNYAGTSFVTLDMFGHYPYGSPLLNVSYDPSHPEELASFAYDDEGSRAEKMLLIDNGILKRPLGGQLSQSRAASLGVANSRASGWNRAPIDRMANLNVEPGSTSFSDMIAGIERGVLMSTNLSWSIDDSRNKFQFGCEWGQLIEHGKLTRVVKNPNYRGISATFWHSLKAVGDPASCEVHGTQFCGKGEPNQVIHVGHASPPCVFEDVDVFGGED